MYGQSYVIWIDKVCFSFFFQINYLYLWMEVHFFVFTFKEISHVYFLQGNVHRICVVRLFIRYQSYVISIWIDKVCYANAFYSN